eukprot:1313810-Ditylum_brightwellii.AAC.1
MTFDTAQSRCGTDDKELCDFYQIFAPGYKTGYHWTTANCSIKVKINEEGEVAIVYDISNRQGDQELHVSEESLNYFKVYWKDDDYPKTANNCGNISECVGLNGGGCQCSTVVANSVVFENMPNTTEDIFSALVVGAIEPGAFDNGTYTTQGNDDFTAYVINGTIDKSTIFEVTDAMSRKFFLKNLKSVVQIGANISFRNAPHFMSMISDYSWPIGSGETTRRDAEYETDAVLDHYFYHQNVAPFLCLRLIQRFGQSNPSPRYVEACNAAFRNGIYYTTSNAYGTGKYGDLSATIASIILDREARTPVIDIDPSAGSVREPILKVTGLMRALGYTRNEKVPTINLSLMMTKIGQMAYSFESVFSFFLPKQIPSSGPLTAASLYSPESVKLEMPLIIGILN